MVEHSADDVLAWSVYGSFVSADLFTGRWLLDRLWFEAFQVSTNPKNSTPAP